MHPLVRKIRRTLADINEVFEDAARMRREARRRYPHVADE